MPFSPPQAKLGEPCPKVRLSQDGMPIIPKKSSELLRSGLFHLGKVHSAVMKVLRHILKNFHLRFFFSFRNFLHLSLEDGYEC
jgi:hypothetical protein